MNSIRKIHKVTDHTLLIDLPESFKDKEVEVIIRPINNHSANQNLSDLLLAGPTWTRQEISKFQALIKKGYNHWTINGF
jgi:hypothetical protein